MKRRPMCAIVTLAALAGCAPVGVGQGDALPTAAPSAAANAPSASSPPSTAPTQAQPPASEPAAPPSSVGPRSVTINVSGDLLWHNTLWAAAEIDAKATGKPKFDFVPQLAGLKDYVSQADLAICHSEVPFAKAEGPYSGYPMFKAPQEVAPAIKEIGWDLCTTASNHTMDAGWDGLVRTIDVHRSNGILTAGTHATAEEAATPVIYTTQEGVKVAVISQTYGLNGLPKAEGKPWSVDLLDADKAVADARRAREAGADVVAVHIHAGTEYSTEINSDQRAFADKVSASPDVDLIFGQHAHVVQPIDRVNGKWVVYGAGNLIASSGPSKPWTYDGYLAQITFTEKADGSFSGTAAEFAPTFITRHSSAAPARVYIIADELAKGTPLAAEMEKSAERTRTVVHSLGVEGLTERQ